MPTKTLTAMEETMEKTLPADEVDFQHFEPDMTHLELTDIFLEKAFQKNFVLEPTVIQTLTPRQMGVATETYLTLIQAGLVQADKANYARLDISSHAPGERRPLVQMHFKPADSGITTTRSYVMAFLIDCAQTNNFQVAGFAGAGTIQGTGAKTISGKRKLTVVFRNVPPNQTVYASLEQTAGGGWVFYQASISYPALLLVNP